MISTKSSTKVALVYPYFQTNSPNKRLFPPLGIASLASQLHQVGIDAHVFDCTFSNLESLISELQSFNPSIVGVYSMASMSKNAFQVAAGVRENLPACLLIAGGPLPTLYPDQYLEPFDVVFKGEADLALPKFCIDVDKFEYPRKEFTKLDLSTYDGIQVHAKDHLIDIPPVHHSEKTIQTFPVPFRNEFNDSAYQEFWTYKNGTRTTSLITTFGCPYSCDFCSKPVWGNAFRRRNLDMVFNEIVDVSKRGYDTLWIADDNFTLDPAFLQEFCLRMKGHELKWSCLSRVSGLNLETTKMMKDAGCRMVYLGLESGCEDTLRLMKKRASLWDGIRAIELFRKADIEVAGFFIVGYPGETIPSVEDTFKFALTQPFSEISFNVPYPLPGSELYGKVEDIAAGEDWTEENEVKFLYQTEFDPIWLKSRIHQTMDEFARIQKSSNSLLSSDKVKTYESDLE
jgi:anaerobic magnesium-protoporphyrin IX monomethyl ester cyclase